MLRACLSRSTTRVFILAATWVLWYPVFIDVVLSYIFFLLGPDRIDFGTAVITGFLFIALGFILEIVVLQSALRYLQARRVAWLLFIGLVLQFVLRLGLVSLSFRSNTLAWSWEEHLLYIFGVTYIGPQIILAGLYVVLYTLMKHPKARRFAGVLAGVIFFGAIFAYDAYSHRQAQIVRSHVYDFDDHAVHSRRQSKSQTMLGKLPRPLRVLFKDERWMFLDHKEQPVAFVFPKDIKPDLAYGFYLDVYTDRVLFVENQQGYVYSLGTGARRALVGELQEALRQGRSCLGHDCPARAFISGVHNDQVALTSMTMAAAADVSVYDSNSGRRLSQAQYAGYDESRTYKVWLDGQGYKLILNAKPYPARGLGGQSKKLSVYLEKVAGAYSPLPQDADVVSTAFQDIGKYAFGSVEELSSREPVLTVRATKSARKNSYHSFSIRSLYNLGNRELAVEIDQGLLVIEVTEPRARLVKDDAEIERLLAPASLLVTDAEDHSLTECAYTEVLRKLMFEHDHWLFAFCVL